MLVINTRMCMLNWSFQYISKGKATQIIQRKQNNFFYFYGLKMLDLFVGYLTLNYRIKFCLRNKMILFIFVLYFINAFPRTISKVT